MRTKPQSSLRKMSWAGMLITLTIIILFGCSQKAFAQQWTTTTSGNDIYNANSGNVGVGTTSPGVKLDILSSVNLIARFGSTAGAHSQVLIDAPAAFNSNLTLQRGGVSKWYMGNRASNDRLSFIESTGLVETLTLLQNGNVGIGTTSPGERLVTFGNLLAGNITSHTKLYSTYDTQSPVILELGYGTATASATPYPSLVLSKNLTSTNNLAGTIFFANSNIANDSDKRLTGIATSTDGALNSGTLQFYTSSVGTFTEQMRLTSAGNVGIGTTAPNYKVEVIGSSSRNTLALIGDGDAGGYAGIKIQALTTTGIATNRTSTFNLHMRKDNWYGGDGSGPSFIIETGSKTGGFAAPFVITPTNDIILNSGVGNSGLSYANVGIGKTAPVYKLDVNGEINATGLRINGTPIATGGASPWTPSGSNIYFNTGNVGIGTDIPTTKLHVAGGTRVDGPNGRVYLGTAAATGARGLEFIEENATTYSIRHHDPNVAWQNIAISPHGGNVGVGTATPSRKLHVMGGNVFHQFSATAGQEHGFYTSIRNNHFTSNLYFDGQWKMMTAGKGALISTAPLDGLAFVLYADDISRAANAAASFNTLMRVNMDGNVGIGTTNPSEKLTISSSSHVGLSIEPPTGSFDGSLIFKRGGENKWFIQSRNSGGPADAFTIYDAVNQAFRFTIDRSGKVGIGTDTPAHKLDVAGGIRASSFVFPDGSVQTTAAGGSSQWTNSGSNILFNTGLVGIGAASSAAPLYVTGNEPSLDYATLRVKPTVTHGGIVIDSANNTSQAHLRFFKSGVPKWQFRVPFQDGVEDFRLYSWAASSDVLSITPSGNVGIGTGAAAPTAKLEVQGNINVTGTGPNAGNINISGTINAKYQDVAEWVESSQALTAGTVVVLDHTRSNQVVASSHAYDTRVAGVISLQPGLALGESGAGKVLVATTGRVKIKVDASAGPIKIGDLLVTSDKEGVAKKSEPLMLGGVQIHRPGTLIGKALEPLTKGTGEILVLLSLQ